MEVEGSQCQVEGEDDYKNQDAYCNLEANDTLLLYFSTIFLVN